MPNPPNPTPHNVPKQTPQPKPKPSPSPLAAAKPAKAPKPSAVPMEVLLCDKATHRRLYNRAMANFSNSIKADNEAAAQSAKANCLAALGDLAELGYDSKFEGDRLKIDPFTKPTLL